MTVYREISISQGYPANRRAGAVADAPVEFLLVVCWQVAPDKTPTAHQRAKNWSAQLLCLFCSSGTLLQTYFWAYSSVSFITVLPSPFPLSSGITRTNKEKIEATTYDLRLVAPGVIMKEVFVPDSIKQASSSPSTLHSLEWPTTSGLSPLCRTNTNETGKLLLDLFRLWALQNKFGACHWGRH